MVEFVWQRAKRITPRNHWLYISNDGRHTGRVGIFVRMQQKFMVRNFWVRWVGKVCRGGQLVSIILVSYLTNLTRMSLSITRQLFEGLGRCLLFDDWRLYIGRCRRLLGRRYRFDWLLICRCFFCWNNGCWRWNHCFNDVGFKCRRFFARVDFDEGRRIAADLFFDRLRRRC